MSIIRIEKHGDYTVLANAPLNDERLSWEARGMLAYLLSKPNDWTVNSRALEKQSPASRSKVQRILRELEKFGYLERRRVRGEGGRFEWESIVREVPVPPADTPEPLPAEEPEGESGAEVQPTQGTDTVAPSPTMAQKPRHGETRECFTMAQFSADGKSADGKLGHLINTVLPNTDQLNPNVGDLTTTTALTATAAVKRARVKPQRGKKSAATAAAAAAAAKLPPEVHEALRELGWVGNKREVFAAWKQDPDRLQAWIDYVRAKGGGGGLLRKLLREEPGYPPDEPPQPDLFGGWEAYTTEYEPASTAYIQANDAPLGDDHPDMGISSLPDGDKPPTEESPGNNQAVGFANAGESRDKTPKIQGGGADIPTSHPDIGALPPPTPDMRRWWALAVGQIRNTMSKADFATWLRPARLIACRGDTDHPVFVVATANDYARQWLTERLKKPLERQLLGFAGRPVSVEFVVG